MLKGLEGARAPRSRSGTGTGTTSGTRMGTVRQGARTHVRTSMWLLGPKSHSRIFSSTTQLASRLRHSLHRTSTRAHTPAHCSLLKCPYRCPYRCRCRCPSRCAALRTTTSQAQVSCASIASVPFVRAAQESLAQRVAERAHLESASSCLP